MGEPRKTHAHERMDALIARCLAGDAATAASEIERDGLWERLASHACLSELGGALIERLRAQNVPVPPSAEMQLDAYREHLVAAHAYRRSRIEPALAALKAEGVPFLLLKGAALDAVLYDEPGVRAMIDADVLIRPGDADRADRVLKSCGCRPGADLVREDFYPRYHYERDYFTSHAPPVKIDLHVRPLRPLRYARTVPDDALWDRPQSVMYDNVRVLIPRPENMLIHLAAHAACHGLSELKWFYDIKLWLDHFGDQIDLDVVADKCRRFKLTLAVRCTLVRVADLFGHPTPALAAAVRSVAQPAGLLDRLALAQAPRDADHPAAAVLVNLLCTPGVGFRLGYLESVLLPGRAHLGQLYRRRHPGWVIVAHLLRVLRGITRPLSPAAPDPA